MQITKNNLEKIYTHKELIVTSCVILLCLVLSAAFPADNTFQSISRSVFFLVILPILYIKFILKGSLAEWGWNLQNMKRGAILSAVAFLVGAILFYALIHLTSFSSLYANSLSPLVKTNFGFFLLYELLFFNIFFFTQEFFFKGFVLFAFRQFYVWSILIQSGIYLALLLLSKSLVLQVIPLIFISIAGGAVAYRTRSFLYSYIFGLLFIIILDAYIIHVVK